uniref:hypothetical protein n=1 Tax=Eisenbergiella sp. TaxID=1924109 RepID=UPI003FEE8E33
MDMDKAIGIAAAEAMRHMKIGIFVLDGGGVELAKGHFEVAYALFALVLEWNDGENHV